MDLRFVQLLWFLIQTSAQFDTSTCGVQKGCFLNPPGCDPLVNCMSAFSYRTDDDSILMEINGVATNDITSYVAVGFSNDKRMDNTAVTACSILPGQALKGRLSFNIGTSNQAVTADPNLLNDTLQTISAIYANDRLSCVLRQKILPPDGLTNTQIWPLNQAYYIFLVLGPTTSQGNSIHSLTPGPLFPYVSSDMHNLQSYPSVRLPTITNQEPDVAPEASSVEALNVINNNRLKKIHGILMCIAWMVFFSSAMIFARYFRNHWPNTTPCGLQIWFHMHRILNVIGIALTIASFACIFSAYNWQWTGPRAYQSAELNKTWGSIHSILGLLACVIAWAQPLNAVFRCDHQSSFRVLFNILHRFFGFSAWLMAAASIMIAVRWFKGRFTNAHIALALFVTYIAIFGITLIFSEVLCVRAWWQRRNMVVSSDLEMLPTEEKNSRIILSVEDEKRNRLQLVLSAVFVAIAIATCIGLCCLMGVVPD